MTTFIIFLAPGVQTETDERVVLIRKQKSHGMTFLRTDVVQNKDNQVRHLRAHTKEWVP